MAVSYARLTIDFERVLAFSAFKIIDLALSIVANQIFKICLQWK